MMKYAPLFLIVLLLGCAGDADLLDETVYIQKTVEIEIRERKDHDVPEPDPGEVSIPDSDEIVSRLIVSDRELASLFCNDNRNFSGVDSEIYITSETSDNNFNRLTTNEFQGQVSDVYGPSVFRNYIIDRSINQEIGSDFSINLFSDLNTIRAAGLKAIVRFSYAPSVRVLSTEEEGRRSAEDAVMDKVITHISDLSSTLKDNVDVITCVQIGFVED